MCEANGLVVTVFGNCVLTRVAHIHAQFNRTIYLLAMIIIIPTIEGFVRSFYLFSWMIIRSFVRSFVRPR